DTTDSNVQELKNQLQAERQKDQQAARAAAATADPALASATPAQQAAAASYSPTGVAIPCVPGHPCQQLQQTNVQSQLTPDQQQAQMIAAKERERTENARFASNLAYSRGPEQTQAQSQLTPTQFDPTERQTSGSPVKPPTDDKQQQPEADAGYKRPSEAN